MSQTRRIYTSRHWYFAGGHGAAHAHREENRLFENHQPLSAIGAVVALIVECLLSHFKAIWQYEKYFIRRYML